MLLYKLCNEILALIDGHIEAVENDRRRIDSTGTSIQPSNK
jgi:hypothetical protein